MSEISQPPIDKDLCPDLNELMKGLREQAIENAKIFKPVPTKGTASQWPRLSEPARVHGYTDSTVSNPLRAK